LLLYVECAFAADGLWRWKRPFQPVVGRPNEPIYTWIDFLKIFRVKKNQLGKWLKKTDQKLLWQIT
jgi:hypothetical protein